MKEFLHFLFGWGLIAVVIGVWILIAMLREGYEIFRARCQGYRVKYDLGGHGCCGKEFVQYISGNIDRKLDAHWMNDKFVVKVPMPLSNLYSSSPEEFDVMKERLTSELKRLLGDKAEIIG